MKRTILIASLSVFLNSSFACSCAGRNSFCTDHVYYDLTLSGIVVETFPYGISIKVLHLLHGNDSNDIIKVWDLGGPYDLCNDSSTVARAAYLGGIGDTLIIALPRIDTLKNT